MTGASTDDVWAGFWHLAAAICSEIETSSPDVAVVLHCSGAVVWLAVERLWAATRRQPMPPAIGVRIGQGTAGKYTTEYEIHEWQYEGEDRVGHMLAWAAGQAAWRSAVQARLRAACGAASPSSILVVDDVVADGWTALTAFGVLMGALPDAQIRLMAGLPGFWREILGRAWAAAAHPLLALRMACGWDKDKRELFPDAWWRNLDGHWTALASGLTSGGGDALSSRPIAEDLPTSEYLTRYLPKEEWLAFPIWVAGTLDEKIDSWAAGEASPPSPPEPHRRPQTYTLRAGELFWMQAWLKRWSTLDEFARRCGLPAAEVGERLQKLVDAGEFVRRAGAEADSYGVALKAALLAYDPFTGRADCWPWEKVVRRFDVMTPFAVEYAYASSAGPGVPALVPVPDGCGAPVCGQLLFLAEKFDAQEASDLTLMDGGVVALAPCTAPAASSAGTLLGQALADYADMEEILHIGQAPNLDFVLDGGLSDREKGERLAALAAASLDANSYQYGYDGIRYLMAALDREIETRLTPSYRDAVLRLAGGAPGLAEARLILARQKGLA